MFYRFFYFPPDQTAKKAFSDPFGNDGKPDISTG
ncbi:hypothetical protein SAMN05421820_107245 [Pedobacter steynii]|uniref:Uncharacterized protein n=1 Tax=Pedobacter steynii TaxID=430522 RepID=A0A1H0AYQ2_9SPHI|nr:hypothetical protein SAMN05421820_107245 [Pedobacter steynii]